VEHLFFGRLFRHWTFSFFPIHLRELAAGLLFRLPPYLVRALGGPCFYPQGIWQLPLLSGFNFSSFSSASGKAVLSGWSDGPAAPPASSPPYNFLTPSFASTPSFFPVFFFGHRFGRSCRKFGIPRGIFDDPAPNIQSAPPLIDSFFPPLRFDLPFSPRLIPGPCRPPTYFFLKAGDSFFSSPYLFLCIYRRSSLCDVSPRPPVCWENPFWRCKSRLLSIPTQPRR